MLFSKKELDVVDFKGNSLDFRRLDIYCQYTNFILKSILTHVLFFLSCCCTGIAIQVELLIRAHDCFTVGCYVDGIAEVLHVAQQWVNTLVDAHSFKTMVGIRY